MEVEADLTLTVTVVRLGAWLTVMRFGGKLSRDVTSKSKSSPGNTTPGFCSNRAPHKLKNWVELPIALVFTHPNAKLLSENTRDHSKPFLAMPVALHSTLLSQLVGRSSELA